MGSRVHSPLAPTGKRHSKSVAAYVGIAIVLPTLLPVLLAPCVVLLIIVFTAMRPTIWPVDTQIVLAWLLMGWVTIVSAVNVADAGGYHVALTSTLPLIALFGLVYAFVRDGDALRVVLLALLIAGGIKGVQIVLYATPGGTEVIDGTEIELRPELANSNMYSYVCVVAVLSAVALAALGEKRRPLRVATLGLGAFCFLAILYAGTRGALVGMILGVVVGGLALRFTRIIRITLTVLLTLWAVAFVTLATRIVTVATSTFQSRQDFLFLDGRDKFWPVAQEVIRQRPLMGHGLTGYTAIFPLGVPPHNVPLAIAVALGIPGLALVMAIILWAVRPISVRAGDRVVAAISCLLVAGLWPMWSTGVTEWLLVGWVAVAAAAGATKMSSGAEPRALSVALTPSLTATRRLPAAHGHRATTF